MLGCCVVVLSHCRVVVNYCCRVVVLYSCRVVGLSCCSVASWYWGMFALICCCMVGLVVLNSIGVFYVVVVSCCNLSLLCFVCCGILVVLL